MFGIENLGLGPTPCGERCAQVGEDNCRAHARAEGAAFIAQLTRMFPEQVATGITFRIKWNAHDFGSYADVVVEYEPENEAQVSAAFHIESNTPAEWDDAARASLTAAGLTVAGV